MRGDRALDLNLYTSDVNQKLPPIVGRSGKSPSVFETKSSDDHTKRRGMTAPVDRV